MKFFHIADVHLGAWKEPQLSRLADKAFEEVVNQTISQKADFLLIAGDLFDTSLPSIDKTKLAVECLKRLQENNIPVYAIAGSHDYSPTGKTILEVLEKAGLLHIVSKGTQENNNLTLKYTRDARTKTLITGIPGKKGMLDKKYYEILNRSIQDDKNFRIFMLHTAISELQPKDLYMDSQPMSILPEGFDYYAAGHVHSSLEAEYSKGKIVFSGPLFPTNFRELEENSAGYVIYDNGRIERIKNRQNILSLNLHFNNEKPEQVRAKIKRELEKDIKNAIITIRLSGTVDGKISDINFKDIYQMLYNNGAYYVTKNITKLSTKQLETIKLDVTNKEDVELKIIEEHISQAKTSFDQREMVKALMATLSEEKNENEKISDFNERIIKSFDEIFKGE